MTKFGWQAVLVGHTAHQKAHAFNLDDTGERLIALCGYSTNRAALRDIEDCRRPWCLLCLPLYGRTIPESKTWPT